MPLVALGRVCWEKAGSVRSWELGGMPQGACQLCRVSDALWVQPADPTLDGELKRGSYIPNLCAGFPLPK